MQENVIWYMLAGGLLILEAFTPGMFLFVCFALAALLVGFVHQIFALSFVWQLGLFLVSSTIALIMVKPLLKTMITMPRSEELLYANQLIGKQAMVFKEITAAEMGAVKLFDVDETWLAKANDSKELAQGTTVKILELQGNHLIVEEITV